NDGGAGGGGPGALRGGAVRPGPRRRRPSGDRAGDGHQHGRGGGAGRSPDGPGDRHGGDRQPRQGGGGPGGPERQSHARIRRDRRPRGAVRFFSSKRALSERFATEKSRPPLTELDLGVCAAAGFRAAGVAAGIKRSGGLDLALVVSDLPAAAAGTFTTHRAAAAPVIVSRERVAAGRARGIVVNSG